MCRHFPVAVAALLTSRGVAAQSDNGDEFSNNLFTDLAPLVHHPPRRSNRWLMQKNTGYSNCSENVLRSNLCRSR